MVALFDVSQAGQCGILGLFGSAVFAMDTQADVPVVISTTLEDAALSLTNFDLDR